MERARHRSEEDEVGLRETLALKMVEQFNKNISDPFSHR